MDEYRHHVSGFFAHRPEAEGALTRLVERGLPSDQLQLFDADSGPAISEPKGESNEVLTNVLVDGAVGTAVGTGIGALAQLALVAANVSLFIASPLIAPLVMLGWGASLGGFVGAAAGANTGIEHKEGWLSDLVHDAIANGQVVLVAQTRTPDETAIAREIIEAAVGEFQDTATNA
ncbi:hypothetical protein AT959_05440 [Dechloromonas denitrificans]|uniref:DUF1269 domain-containing protein n=1 Tax=Dechloromonas denitrificans TaxID=281362 RepID=A0A133XLI6_9RHOO|nr:hypothetical protein [Dechloromonas denitrificans]KXB31791.1 hypothetical protein AT959_05440 [Dechloromonas denitrificans]